MDHRDHTTDSAEESRLALLAKLDMLDTGPEASFDTLTTLAAQICGRPISLVSLVDSHRQVFTSRYGTDLAETSRESSFCSLAIATAPEAPGPVELFEVPDTHADDRFRWNPLVTAGPRIRHYAGVLLRPTGDVAIGTLCVIGPETGHLDEEQRATLVRLGSVAEELLRLRLVAKTEAEALARAERSERYYRYLADNTADVVVVHDADLVARYTSPNAPSFLGYSPQEARAFGSHYPVFHPQDAQRLSDSLRSLNVDRPSATLRVRAINKDGTLRHVEVHSTAIFEGEAVVEFGTSARDIDKVVAYEEQLEQTNQQLRTLVDQRSRLIDQRSRLIRGIAHDLAAPAAALRVTAESMRGRLTEPGLAEPGLAKQCERLQDFAQSIEAFISDLRTVAEPEQAGYALAQESVDAKAVVERGIAQVPDIAGEALSTRLEPVTGFADGHALSRITTNLLSNAYRHNPEGTAIDVTLTEEDADIVLRVADRGLGMPEAQRVQAFEPYYSSDPDGSGLGLTITKALVEAQAGTIELSDNEPNGTVVTVRLPCEERDGAAPDTRLVELG